MKKDNCCARPRNEWIPVRVVGVKVLTMKPANGRVVPMANLFLERTIFKSSQFWAILVTLNFSSCMVGAKTRMSSTIFLAHGRLSIMASVCRHHSSQDAFGPCGIRRYLYLPHGSRKVVFREDSLSRAVWKNPFTASIFAKYFADAGFVCKISDTQAKGCTGLSTNELSLVKFVTIRTLLPSGFTTKKAGEHHSVGS